ncbi:hypothetical protein [Cellulomonas sp. RIT-PI-Y]|uniref:hypothetical protein n=1 Tax=Cellulomonas sp. RIT-PI-Y TaxID=3035297 RepID=UPI0021DA7302|nr:hypothetical protein [Cellulomonas sp. RIT-PI-Y]
MSAEVDAVDVVSLHCGPATAFPTINDDAPVIRVVVENATTDGVTFAVATNLGADLVGEDAARAVGVALHRLAHALLGGLTVDLTAPTPGGVS